MRNSRNFTDIQKFRISGILNFSQSLIQNDGNFKIEEFINSERPEFRNSGIQIQNFRNSEIQQIRNTGIPQRIENTGNSETLNFHFQIEFLSSVITHAPCLRSCPPAAGEGVEIDQRTHRQPNPHFPQASCCASCSAAWS